MEDTKKISSFALQKAAQAWCQEETSHIVMIPELAEAFAKILQDYIEAIQWCGGSQDFQLDGQARKGWESICMPLIGDK